MNLEYVDIFYSHRYDPDTPLEETLQALVDIVRQGKALYVGISKYPKEAARVCLQIPGRTGCTLPALSRQIQSLQPRTGRRRYPAASQRERNRLHRLLPAAQGLLTNRYLNGIPEDSRMAKGAFLKKEALTDETLQKIKALNEGCCLTRANPCRDVTCLAVEGRPGDKRHHRSELVAQLADNLKATENTDFSAEELEKIKKIIQK